MQGSTTEPDSLQEGQLAAKELTLTDRSDQEMTSRYKKFAIGFAIASCGLCLLFVGLAVLVNVLMKH